MFQRSSFFVRVSWTVVNYKNGPQDVCQHILWLSCFRKKSTYTDNQCSHNNSIIICMAHAVKFRLLPCYYLPE